MSDFGQNLAKICFFGLRGLENLHFGIYKIILEHIRVLGMYIGVFDHEKTDKARFKALKRLFVPNLGQKPVF